MPKTTHWPIESWGSQKVCSFCPETIRARYDQLPSVGWFGLALERGGFRVGVILGCPEHRNVADKVSLLWLQFLENPPAYNFSSLLREHGFCRLEPARRGPFGAGVPQLFFKVIHGDKAHG